LKLEIKRSQNRLQGSVRREAAKGVIGYA